MIAISTTPERANRVLSTGKRFLFVEDFPAGQCPVAIAIHDGTGIVGVAMVLASETTTEWIRRHVSREMSLEMIEEFDNDGCVPGWKVLEIAGLGRARLTKPIPYRMNKLPFRKVGSKMQRRIMEEVK